MSEHDRMLQTLPLSGSWGLLVSLMTMSHGATLVMPEAALPRELLRVLESERITTWHAVDTTLRAVLEHPELDRYDRSALRGGCAGMTGGGRHNLFDEVMTRLGMSGAFRAYGMTEINSLTLFPAPHDPPDLRRRPGGLPLEGHEIRVVDPDTGEPCAVGNPGELRIRGRSVTRGYYGNPEETAAMFDAAGWFRTGDLGTQDETGRIFFLGRLKETLRIGHLMVAPADIETFLLGHPKLAQAFVVGVPDASLGEVAAAYVIPRPGESPTEKELQDYCRGRLAAFKAPRHIWVVEDVPRTRGPHGDKAKRMELREMALRTLGLSA
jgi:fatty-acyl-CoA synthase